MNIYEKYKDSGIEWIGEIPEHWEVKKLKYVSKVQTGRTPKISGSEINFFENGTINWYTPGDFTIGKKLNDSRRKVIEEALHQNQAELFEEYSTYLVSIGATLGKVSLSIKKASANQQINVITFDKEKLNPFYGFLFILGNPEMILNEADYTTLPILNQNKLNNISLAIPPKTEQTAIANYLDKKTAEIDQLIADKKRLVELYQEEKTAIINQAVTKGINPNVKLKDSGIEWLGSIPEHWEVKKLNGISNFVRGNSSFKKDELLKEGKYVALQYGKTYKVDEIDENFEFYVNDEFYKDSQVVNNGDVIIISTSETIEDLGHSAFYNRIDLGLLGGEQMVLKPKSEKINGKYLYYSSKSFTKELQKYARGIKVLRFNIDNLKTIYTSVPPKQEQTQIVQHIEKESARIDAKINKAEQYIQLLTEYRTALISEVVTGKVKVIENWELKIES